VLVKYHRLEAAGRLSAGVAIFNAWPSFSRKLTGVSALINGTE